MAKAQTSYKIIAFIPLFLGALSILCLIIVGLGLRGEGFGSLQTLYFFRVSTLFLLLKSTTNRRRQLSKISTWT